MMLPSRPALRRPPAQRPAHARKAHAGFYPPLFELLARRHGMPPVQAYMLCSVCGDLLISEIVDQPNWTVSFYFPRVVFE